MVGATKVRSKTTPAPVKAYKAAVDELVRNSEVRTSDLDGKFFFLLDKLEQKEKAIEGVRHVAQALEGKERESIHSWRAYVYTLLRKFDEATYQSLKTTEDGKDVATPKRAQDGAEGFVPAALNISAPEFQPGLYWGGSLAGATPPAEIPLPMTPGLPPMTQVPYGLETSVGFFGMPEPMRLPDYIATPPPRAMNGSYDMSSGVKQTFNSGKVPRSPGSPSLSKLLNLDDDESPSSMPPPPPPPALPTGPLPSPGSAGHAGGNCKPCAFLHTKGCSNGANCQFCHLCDQEEKKRRKREKRTAAPINAVSAS